MHQLMHTHMSCECECECCCLWDIGSVSKSSESRKLGSGFQSWTGAIDPETPGKLGLRAGYSAKPLEGGRRTSNRLLKNRGRSRLSVGQQVDKPEQPVFYGCWRGTKVLDRNCRVTGDWRAATLETGELQHQSLITCTLTWIGRHRVTITTISQTHKL